MFDFAEKTSNMSAVEILNYYRNLYYTEPQVTERGIVANAIYDVLGIINSQKEEIEQWQEEANSWQTCFCKEIDNREEIKAEAYKEFAERIRECCTYNDDLSADAWLSVTKDISCVLKEMVGEEE